MKFKPKTVKHSKLNFKDISTEAYRVYHYPDGSSFRIDNPRYVAINSSSMGGHAHRVINGKEHSFYVRPGWNAIEWSVFKDEPHFTF